MHCSDVTSICVTLLYPPHICKLYDCINAIKMFNSTQSCETWLFGELSNHEACEDNSLYHINNFLLQLVLAEYIMYMYATTINCYTQI